MAELIPTEYRIRVAIRERIRRWFLAGALVLALVALGLSYSLLQNRRSANALARLDDECRARRSLIAQSDQLRARRQAMAERMQKIEQIMDDKVLLALLHQIADGFSSHDYLEYIHIDARGAARQVSNDGADGATSLDPQDHYTVALNGLTTNTTTLAELMTRLSAPTKLPVSVMLEKSNRENVLQGQVVRFQINCQRGNGPAATAG